MSAEAAGTKLQPRGAAIVVVCSVPMDFDAEALGVTLIQRSLAACVQISPSVTSIYRWEGSIEKSAERVIMIKTRKDLFDPLEAAIRAAHPYEVPEIISLEVSDGHAPYLAWIAQSTTA